MIFESFHKEEEMERKTADVTKGFALLLLSVATSLDALAVRIEFRRAPRAYRFPPQRSSASFASR